MIYREDIVEGLDNAPQAFLGLFHGRDLAKLIVRVASRDAGEGVGRPRVAGIKTHANSMWIRCRC